MRYKNIAGKDLFLRGFGLVKKDQEINAKSIKNKNFKIVSENKKVVKKVNKLK
jgi:hypothetical protein